MQVAAAVLMTLAVTLVGIVWLIRWALIRLWGVLRDWFYAAL